MINDLNHSPAVRLLDTGSCAGGFTSTRSHTNGRTEPGKARHVVYAALGALLATAAVSPFLLLALALSQGIVVV